MAKYRDAGKIDKHLYHTLYKSAKGNTFKHKRSLVEHIITAKAEALREKALKDEAEARRVRNRAARERRQQRVAEKREAFLNQGYFISLVISCTERRSRKNRGISGT